MTDANEFEIIFALFDNTLNEITSDVAFSAPSHV